MDTFARPKFCEQILNLGRAYGPPEFWLQNLNLTSNPDATWRALMVLAAVGNVHLADLARPLLRHPDSRVRAWACFTLGQVKDEQSLELIYQLSGEPSTRVRVHAWQAIQSIVGPEANTRHLAPLRERGDSLILISEDSLANQKLISRLLEERGYRTLAAQTEQDTIALAHQFLPQAILTDNQKFSDNLSGLNMTWDLTRQPDLRETLLFMLSMDPIEPVFLWQGGDYYIAKEGFTPSTFLNSIDAYLLH